MKKKPQGSEQDEEKKKVPPADDQNDHEDEEDDADDTEEEDDSSEDEGDDADESEDDDSDEDSDSEDDEDSDDEDDSDDSEDDDSDENLKIENKLLEEKLAKAEKKIKKLRAKKGEDTDEDDTDDEDEQEDKDIDQVVDAKVSKALRIVIEDKVDDAIAEYTKDPKMITRIKYHFKNTVPPKDWTSREIREAVDNAYLIANKKRFRDESKMRQLKRKSDRSTGKHSSSGEGAHRDPKITPYDRHMAKKWFRGDIKKWMKYKDTQE